MPSAHWMTRSRALARPAPMHARDWFDDDDSAFRPLDRPSAAAPLHICIVTQEYLPKQLNGIGRFSHELAVALADRGHVVRILTEADEHGQRRLSRTASGCIASLRAWPAPRRRIDARRRIWDFSASVLRELRRIDDAHPWTSCSPNWNSEGIAVLEDGAFTTVLGLHTPLATIARIDPRIDPKHPRHVSSSLLSAAATS